VGEAASDTPILAHTPFLTAPLRQKARAAGPFDVAIRGDLDSMWLAISGILGVGTGRAVPAA
jgi:hypothetical protein